MPTSDTVATNDTVLTSDTRTRLLDAAKQLVWERGVEATSPNMVLTRSGVGQGSLYHYFDSKSAWAEAAIDALARELTDETDELFASAETGVEQLRAYLSKPRAALSGCRLGRLAFDPELVERPLLREPITTYFDHLRARLRTAVRQAKADGAIAPDVNTGAVVEAICAVVQGGYVTARLADDPKALERACRGLRDLLGPSVAPDAHPGKKPGKGKRKHV